MVPSLAAFHGGPGWAPVGPRLGLTGAHLGMLLGLSQSTPRLKLSHLINMSYFTGKSNEYNQ